MFLLGADGVVINSTNKSSQRYFIRMQILAEVHAQIKPKTDQIANLTLERREMA